MPTILLKKSDTPSAVPTTANLTNLAGGVEVAVNTADKRMFTMNSSSAVVELGTNPSSLTCADASFTVARVGSLTISSLSLTNATFASATITNLTSTSATISSALTLSGGTANGVLYLNASKVATSGSALTFDGTNLSNIRSVATAYSGTNSATWSNGITLINTATPGTGVANLLTFQGTSNVNTTFGVAQNASGYGDFVWAQFNGSFVENMRLTSSGNVGIGTSSPATKLHVAGTIRSGATGASGRVEVARSSDGAVLGFLYNPTGDVFAIAQGGGGSANPIAFYTAGTEKMRLDEPGNLGLGRDAECVG
jgi:hypothetical protein